MARKNARTAKIAASEVALTDEHCVEALEAIVAELEISEVSHSTDPAEEAAYQTHIAAEDAEHPAGWAEVDTSTEETTLAEALELPPETTLGELSVDHLIDPAYETAASAGIVDYGSHIGSTWVRPDVAEDMIGPAMSGHNDGSSFDQLAQSFDDAEVNTMVFATAQQMDLRADFERTKNVENTNIQRTLDKIRKQLVTKRAARVMMACGIVDPTFINRQVHDGSAYNVYALGKLADVIFGVSDGMISNAINLACMRSLFACAKADVVFTSDVARACASNKIHIDPAVRKHLVRHTVSASTAPTQASSTMQALATLGVVSVSGSTRSPVYTLTDKPIVEKLQQKLAA